MISVLYLGKRKNGDPVHMKLSLYRPELDQLRFIAFIAVFLSHSLPYDAASYINQGVAAWLAPWLGSIAMAGAFGVDLFFALSSYLITQLLQREQQREGLIDIRAFWLRRILRIWPLYFLFILLTLILFNPLFDDQLTGRYLSSFLLLSGNWAFAFWGAAGSVAAPLWSVSIEEQFYLLWPVLLTRFKPKQLKYVCIGLLLLASLSRALAAWAELPHVFFWCSTFTRLDPIVGGILVALVVGQRQIQLSPIQRNLLWLVGLALPVLALRWGGLASFTGWPTLWLHPLASIASLLLLVSVLHSKQQLSRLGEFCCHLGRISYGLYVFHLLGLKLASLLIKQSWWPTPLFFGLNILLALAFTLILAQLSYHYFERPFLKLKARYTKVHSGPNSSC